MSEVFSDMPHGTDTGGKEAVPTAEWLVTQYGLGQLPRAAATLAEAYLELNPGMRPTVQRIESVGGWCLEHAEPAALNKALTAGDLLSRVERVGDEKILAPAPALAGNALPESIARHIHGPLAGLPWKWRGFGAYEYRLRDLEDDGIIARLLRIEPGKAVPQHTHDGMEATLVLHGAYRDEAGLFRPGDVEIADHAVDHQPVAEPGATCICFAVNEAPMRLTGRIGRFLQSFM